jgi:hypothetical protein
MDVAVACAPAGGGLEVEDRAPAAELRARGRRMRSAASRRAAIEVAQASRRCELRSSVSASSRSSVPTGCVASVANAFRSVLTRPFGSASARRPRPDSASWSHGVGGRAAAASSSNSSIPISSSSRAGAIGRERGAGQPVFEQQPVAGEQVQERPWRR